MDLQKLFFTTNGRINRQPYFLVQFGLGVFSGVFFSIFGEATNLFIVISEVAVSLAILVANFALVIKRLHDLNKTGWLALILLIPLVNILFGLYLIFVKGTDGPNKYGEDPLQQ